MENIDGIIKELQYILGELYCRYGLEEEIVLLSQLLDKLIYIKMKEKIKNKL
ncbi:MAG: hypothetical protein ACRCYC_15635 [Paraclostridium sp.]|uniref:hypothetical protein n=1 Tax=Paraclostridium sp. TaxID=2023273 RepID=UPI0030608139